MRENGKSYGQIAAALGLSENTVKSLYVQGYGGACDAELLYRRTDPQHPQTPCGGHARVSTNDEEQANSYEAQVSHYTRHIQENLEWEFVSVYADKGITGTSTKKRGIPPQNTRRWSGNATTSISTMHIVPRQVCAMKLLRTASSWRSTGC